MAVVAAARLPFPNPPQFLACGRRGATPVIATGDARRQQRSGLLAPIAEHVGDGNFHLAIVVDPEDAEEMARASDLNDRMVEHALALGTCTGEHGVGLDKRRHLAAEAGTSLDVMRAVKQALDSHGILNPEKIFLTHGVLTE